MFPNLYTNRTTLMEYSSIYIYIYIYIYIERERERESWWEKSDKMWKTKMDKVDKPKHRQQIQVFDEI